ncbi:DNA-binding IclR family transcriptional regulator [Kineococcus xinjiangensis]|uniref:Glycerol operon regulatory protein n=1 Tax=Kineococcus xinjiangensis TaxID=512762 RepID=A0A2S6ITE2_9ACTN|nr:IclR family transcriptional regulator [Kineococcus xinjiangensis]PPK97450.1 DNA-binding IclR family transcriptional regulator [Kineococcus xinjiangensis]
MPGSIQSIERAAALLKLMARTPGGLGVVDAANALGLAKGTTHGILRTLVGVGFVEQDPAGRYRASATLADLAEAGLDANELRSRAVNWADSLASRTGEAVRIATLTEGGVLVVHHVFRPDDSQQEMEVGDVLPAHACALGKVLLASTGTPRGHLVRYTSRTITQPLALRRALTAVREQGWALDVDEHVPGQASIAAPVRDRGGLVVGAIDVHGAVDDLVDPRLRPRAGLVPAVRHAARAISRDLGAESA